MRFLFSFCLLAILIDLTAAGGIEAQDAAAEPDVAVPADALGADFASGDNYFAPAIYDQWFCPDYWEGSFEVGINGQAGNTEALSYLMGFDLSRTSPLSESQILFDYALATTNGLQTQNFGLLTVNWDRVFIEGSPWSVYSKSRLLFDEFRPFDRRWSTNGGIGYKWLDNEAGLFRTRFGTGVSREFGGLNKRWVPEAAFGLDWKRQLGAFQKINASIDYFPDWDNFDDFRMVSDIGWELLLNPASNMSLKLSILDTYDSTPDGARPNDINYGLLLLWKM